MRSTQLLTLSRYSARFELNEMSWWFFFYRTDAEHWTFDRVSQKLNSFCSVEWITNQLSSYQYWYILFQVDKSKFNKSHVIFIRSSSWRYQMATDRSQYTLLSSSTTDCLRNYRDTWVDTHTYQCDIEHTLGKCWRKAEEFIVDTLLASVMIWADRMWNLS